VTFGKKDEQIFLGREISQHRDYSEATAVDIDNEVKRIVTESHEKARDLLTENIEILKQIAETLLEIEVLNSDQLNEILDGRLPQEVEG
jgi:cell division protease FtsH